MKIGLTEGTIAGDPAQMPRHAAAIGVSGIEPYIGDAGSPYYDWSDRDIKAFLKFASSKGVSVPSLALGLFNNDPALVTGAAFDRVCEQIVSTLKVTRALGARLMLLCAYVESEPDTPAKRANLAKVIRAVEPVAKELGVAIAIETPLAAADLADLVDQINSSKVGVYYDIGNAVAVGFDPVNEIKILGERILAVHIKDSSDQLGALHLGDGKVDLDASIGALIAIGYDGWLMLETPGDGEQAVRRDLQRCVAILVHRRYIESGAVIKRD
jgi:L-ribulose-5-phosphate 3-epimerase